MLDKIIEEQIKNSLLGESKEMIKNYAKDIVFTMYMSNAMFGQEVLEELKQFLIQELNKNIPHEITEDFAFKRPTAFIFDGCAYSEMNCWSELYIQFVAHWVKKNPAKAKELADHPDFISKQNRKYYSTSNSEMRKAVKIMNDFYVETNLSANDFAKRIIEILNFSGMKTSSITIYLRQDRNA